MHAIRLVVSAGIGLVALAGSAVAQVSFRPATELVAVEPPSGVVPLNAAQVILGMADRYVYQFLIGGVATGSRIRVTHDFVGFTQLTLPDGGAVTEPIGVSQDGRRVLGRVGYFTAGMSRAVIWENEGAPQVMAVGNGQNQRPRQADADCAHWALTIGTSSSAVESYLAGLDENKSINPFEGEEVESVYCSAISPDGLTIAGQFNGSTGPCFVWSEAEGERHPEPARGNLPCMVSDHGTRLVTGGLFAADRTSALSETYGPSGMRTLTGMRGTYLSRDGTALLGHTTAATSRAAWWTETLGREDLNDALSARGIDLRGWTLREARYISEDGRTLVGRGTAPGSDAMRWWVATIEPRAAADMGKAGGRFGSDGRLDNNDFIAFIDKFFASDARADVGRAGGLRGGDGSFDTNDFCAFISLFFDGQP